MPDLLGVFNLTKRLKSTVPERMSTISLFKKLDMSIKGSAVNQESFSCFISTLKT